MYQQSVDEKCLHIYTDGKRKKRRLQRSGSKYLYRCTSDEIRNIYLISNIYQQRKIPTEILWGEVYAAGSLLEEPLGIAVSGDSFCIKMILHCSNNANIRL